MFSFADYSERGSEILSSSVSAEEEGKEEGRGEVCRDSNDAAGRSVYGVPIIDICICE